MGALLVNFSTLVQLALRGLRAEHLARVIISLGVFLGATPLAALSLDWTLRLKAELKVYPPSP